MSAVKEIVLPLLLIAISGLVVNGLALQQADTLDLISFLEEYEMERERQGYAVNGSNSSHLPAPSKATTPEGSEISVSKAPLASGNASVNYAGPGNAPRPSEVDLTLAAPVTTNLTAIYGMPKTITKPNGTDGGNSKQ